jgi:hypothetical protein
MLTHSKPLSAQDIPQLTRINIGVIIVSIEVVGGCCSIPQRIKKEK